MTRYQPIFKWYEDEGGDLDAYDTVEDLVNDIQQRMLTKGTKREKTSKEIQRIKDLTSSDNFKQEFDIQKSIINKFKKRLEKKGTQSGLKSIEDELDIPKNIDLTSSSKKEVKDEVEIISNTISESEFIKFINENNRFRNDNFRYFDKDTGIPNFTYTKGFLKTFDLNNKKMEELINKSKRRVSIL